MTQKNGKPPGRVWLLTWDDVLCDLWRRSNVRIAAELSLAFSPETFTPAQVRHRRHVLGLHHGPDRRWVHLAFVHADRRRLYQCKRGWMHLLPDYPLARREVDILCLLRDRGPLTRPEIACALGLRTLRRHGGGGCRLRLLYEWGLVRRLRRHRAGARRFLPVYALEGPALVITDQPDREDQ